MDMNTEIALRFVERVVAVVIGGMAVYLGYRLFLKVPEQRNSQGKVTLPWDITVVMSRVGPGVFFALFGAAVVAYSLRAAVTLTRSAGQAAPDGNERPAVTEAYSGLNQGQGAGAGALQARRVAARLDMDFLNGLPQLLKPALSSEEARSVPERIASLKLRLMAPLWGPDWGSLEAFRAWVDGGAHDPVPKGLEAAVAYFRSGQEGVR